MTNPTKSAMGVWERSIMEYGAAEFLKQNPENAAATVIDQALQAARDEERAAIMAWLNDRALSSAQDDEHGAARYNALHFASLGVQRGEHLRSEKSSGGDALSP